MLATGVIVPSKSEWASRIVAVAKKDAIVTFFLPQDTEFNNN